MVHDHLQEGKFGPAFHTTQVEIIPFGKSGEEVEERSE